MFDCLIGIESIFKLQYCSTSGTSVDMQQTFTASIVQIILNKFNLNYINMLTITLFSRSFIRRRSDWLYNIFRLLVLLLKVIANAVCRFMIHTASFTAREALTCCPCVSTFSNDVHWAFLSKHHIRTWIWWQLIRTTRISTTFFNCFNFRPNTVIQRFRYGNGHVE